MLLWLLWLLLLLWLCIDLAFYGQPLLVHGLLLLRVGVFGLSRDTHVAKAYFLGYGAYAGLSLILCRDGPIVVQLSSVVEVVVEFEVVLVGTAGTASRKVVGV